MLFQQVESHVLYVALLLYVMHRAYRPPTGQARSLVAWRL